MVETEPLTPYQRDKREYARDMLDMLVDRERRELKFKPITADKGDK